MPDVLSYTADWLIARVQDVSTAVDQELTAISHNNGLAVETQSLINGIADPALRAQLTADVNHWVGNQGILVSGYRKFKAAWDSAFAQAKSFLQQVGEWTGLSGMGMSGLGQAQLIPVPVIVAGTVLAVWGVAQIIHNFNNTQGQAIGGYLQLAQQFTNKTTTAADKQSLIDFTNSYKSMAENATKQSPDIFSSAADLIKWLVVGGAVLLLLPQVTSMLKGSRARAA